MARVDSRSDAAVSARVCVKICGVTRTADAVAAARLGADLLGLNFHPPSPRCVSPSRAAELAASAREVAPDLRVAGVFVEQDADEIEAIAAEAGLDLIQLHGDPDEELVRRFSDRAIQVVRVEERLEKGALEGLAPSWATLVDARHPSLWGGSGHTWDWSSLGRAGGTRVLVAGGLTPENVGALLETARPWGVDVASGVESEPGIKDHERMEHLFQEIDRYGESTAAS